jgi:hypothetical protein
VSDAGTKRNVFNAPVQGVPTDTPSPDKGMDPVDFLNQLAALASLERWAAHVEENLDALDAHELPPEGLTIFEEQKTAQSKPRAYRTEDAGLVVVARYSGKEPNLRMVCWASCGEEEFMGIAAEWWKTNNPAWNKDKTDG